MLITVANNQLQMHVVRSIALSYEVKTLCVRDDNPLRARAVGQMHFPTPPSKFQTHASLESSPAPNGNDKAVAHMGNATASTATTRHRVRKPKLNIASSAKGRGLLV